MLLALRAPISRDSLRRRYGKARAKVGLDRLPFGIISSSAHEELCRETTALLENMAIGLLD